MGMRDLKYITVRPATQEDCTPLPYDQLNLAIVFNGAISHSLIYQTVYEEYELIGAGFCVIGLDTNTKVLKIKTFGESSSLDAKPNPFDAEIIRKTLTRTLIY